MVPVFSYHAVTSLPSPNREAEGGVAGVGTARSDLFSTWRAHIDNHTHNLWTCFLCHVTFMQPALTPPITSPLSSLHTHIHTLCLTPLLSPTVEIYWCPLMFSVPGFLPGISYSWCLWKQEETPAGHLLESLLVISSCGNLPYHFTTAARPLDVSVPTKAASSWF